MHARIEHILHSTVYSIAMATHTKGILESFSDFAVTQMDPDPHNEASPQQKTDQNMFGKFKLVFQEDVHEGTLDLLHSA